ncbi:unnamed protein product, partial [Ectocarpus sp. 4 AP-2014]
MMILFADVSRNQLIVELNTSNARKEGENSLIFFSFSPPSHQSAHERFHNAARYARSPCNPPSTLLSHVMCNNPWLAGGYTTPPYNRAHWPPVVCRLQLTAVWSAACTKPHDRYR